MNIKGLIVILIFLSTSLPASARVFNYKYSWVSAYLGGTAGLSSIGDTLYADTSGTNTTFNHDVLYNFSGEMGFAFQLGDKVVMRLGIEGLQTKNMTTSGYKSGTATKYLDVEAKTTAFVPSFALEYGFHNTGTSRFFAYGNVGYATVKASHNYTPTATAATDYSIAATPYGETWVGNAISYQVGGGWEAHLLDNVTLSMALGWRQLSVKSLKYDSASTVIRGASGVAVASGGPVTDNNGNKVSLDLGGYFVGVLFKFYIPPLN